jgi:hypothetical protein
MLNAAGGGAQASHGQDDAYRAVIFDRTRPERPAADRTTIARETSPETSPGRPESSTNVIVLDDVSPRYMKAAAALQASPLDPCDSDPCASSAPALSVIGARHGTVLLERPMSLRRRLSPGFSRAVNDLLRSQAGVRHATGAPRASAEPASRRDRPQCIASSAFDEAPERFLAFLPLRKRMSISVPLTRTSSQRR